MGGNHTVCEAAMKVVRFEREGIFSDGHTKADEKGVCVKTQGLLSVLSVYT